MGQLASRLFHSSQHGKQHVEGCQKPRAGVGSLWPLGSFQPMKKLKPAWEGITWPGAAQRIRHLKTALNSFSPQPPPQQPSLLLSCACTYLAREGPDICSEGDIYLSYSGVEICSCGNKTNHKFWPRAAKCCELLSLNP